MRSSPWMRRRCSFATDLGLGCSTAHSSWLWLGTSCTSVTRTIDRLQVFSFTGEHRRSITGAWRSALVPLWCKGPPLPRRGRIRCDGERRTTNDDDPAAPLQGRRILVLSLQGDVLQVVTHPSEPAAIFSSICCFDGKLLAGQRYVQAGGHAIAFQGL